MIEFEKVSVRLGRRMILRNLNFMIGFEERVAVIGGSGAGKTTLLKLIVGLLHPSEGRVLIDGSDIAAMNGDELKRTHLKFTIVFQEGALFDSMSVRDNVAFLLREYTRLPEKEIDYRVYGLLEKVGLEAATAYLMPEELSGGMKRRVAIARSLAGSDPKMFLYDEPTADLDPVSAALIRGLIRNLTESNRGFIMVTHEIATALAMAQRFFFLTGGTVSFDGTKEEFLRSPQREIRAFFEETI